MSGGQNQVLVVNCGSGSLAVDIVSPDGTEHPLLRRDAPFSGIDAHRDLALAVSEVGDSSTAVAHRFVHGGERRQPVRLDEPEFERLTGLSWLAPLHLPPALDAARVVGEALNTTPGWACFDTAFHATLDAASRALALPARWRDQEQIERYGFHGPGHQWAAERTAVLLGRPIAEVEVVTAHLGGGASACAVHGGRSVDTTMAFTPLAGMAMTTRPGSVDPGVVLRMIETGSTVEQLTEEVNRSSGMLGLSETSGDLRDLYPAADQGDTQARLAIDVYARGVAQGIAAMATSLSRLDAIAFTGGAGTASWRLRADVCRRLGTIGITLDETANAAATDDALVHAPGARTAISVITAREAAMLARSVRSALEAS